MAGTSVEISWFLPRSFLVGTARSASPKLLMLFTESDLFP